MDEELTDEEFQCLLDQEDWENISKHQYLTEDFIRQNKDRVDWWYISIYQKLSEDFLIEFQDDINWWAISAYQKLSYEFIKRYHNVLSCKELLHNDKLDPGKVEQIYEQYGQFGG